MMKKSVLILMCIYIFHFQLYSQAVQSSSALKVTTFKLANGLTVYLNEDHTSPKIFGEIVVKAGSDNEDPNATGIAHYFEHIMFKGTDKIGTTDWAKESIVLDSIRLKYDELGRTKDARQRELIQKEINRLSIQDAKYTIPNEVGKLIQYFGGTGMNAYTFYDRTVYFNSFPSNQLEPWLDIYAERFRNPVYRLFQSELETVYEEKNRASDNIFNLVIDSISNIVMQGHPAGDHSIIGKTDHLKNPNQSKMNEFYAKYYVASNMALVLCGDFDPETAKKWIEEKFSNLKQGSSAEPIVAKPKQIKGRNFVKMRITPVKVAVMAFHTVPKSNPDFEALQVATSLLSNSTATGLFDKLRVEGKLLMVVPFQFQLSDVASNYFFIVPKIIGQSLPKAEKLIQTELNRLKNGDFSDDLLSSVKLTEELNYKREQETLSGRGNAFVDIFLNGAKWEDGETKLRKIKSLTKEDIKAVAKKYYGDDFWMIYSKTGFPKKEKLKKPIYEPVVPQTEISESEFTKNLKNKPSIDFKPKFIEIGKDVLVSEIKDKVHFYYTPNPYNDIFTLNLKYGQGAQNDKLLTKLAFYLQNVGSESRGAAQFKSDLQRLGASYTVWADEKFFQISITGLEANLEGILKLMDEWMRKPQNDASQLKRIVSNTKADIRFDGLDKALLTKALYEYGLYGEKAVGLNRLSISETKKLTVSQLLEDFKKVQEYELDIHYVGTLNVDSVKNIIKNRIHLSDSMQKTNSLTYKARNTYHQNTIFFLNESKARQTNVMMCKDGNPIGSNERPQMHAFNQYFGMGMSSLLFQEIREFRSLAYDVSGGYSQDLINGDKPGCTLCHLGTQADKTIEAMQVMNNLLDSLPQKADRMSLITSGMILSINTETPDFRDKSSFVQNFRDAGFTYDIRKDEYEAYKNLKFDDLYTFYKKNVFGRPSFFAVVGDKKMIDLSKLSKFGVIKEIKKKEIFKN